MGALPRSGDLEELAPQILKWPQQKVKVIQSAGSFL
jgi:hypothetical protein